MLYWVYLKPYSRAFNPVSYNLIKTVTEKFLYSVEHPNLYESKCRLAYPGLRNWLTQDVNHLAALGWVQTNEGRLSTKQSAGLYSISAG